jgi:5'-nucleotidase
MRILITNDDSVSAAGLPALIHWCEKIGDVTVVVPKFEQSAKSHGINIHTPFAVEQVELEPGLTVWTVDSTPADCVRYALFGLKMTFDLVISGINRGFNVGKDIMYSGTVAAISEAVAQGIPGIALSTSVPYYPHAHEHLQEVWDFMQENGLMGLATCYNINIPPQSKGIRITHQGGPYFCDDFKPLGDGTVIACGKCVHEDRGNITLDTDAVVHNYISLMPMTIVRTDMEVYNRLTHLNG